MFGTGFLAHSLKQSIRERRTHCDSRDNACLYTSACSEELGPFSRSNDNKEELFHYLSECIQARET